MATLEKAISLAVEHHAGQVDRAGKPYVLHVLRVMLLLETVEEQIVGVLHDIVEDTEVTFESLRLYGFSDEVIEALSFVTKLPEEGDYDAFIERVLRGPVLARKVKIADLTDNSDLRRLTSPSEKDLERQAKYQKALKLLLDSL